jgi:hypothetical protein
MVDKQVRQKLLERLQISPQRLSQRAAKIKDRYGPMTTEEAVYVIAHIEGIDLSRYLHLATLDRVRALVPRTLPDLRATPKGRPTSKSPPKSRRAADSYPLVSSSLLAESVRLGSQAFPEIFVLENSIRALIQKHLSSFGPNWWEELIPKDVQTNIQRTMNKEKRFTYREARGDHELLYSNFADLKKIILANQPTFKDIIIDFDWFKVKMDETYMARNNLAHCVPLSQDDAARISLFNRDWARILEAAGEE